MCRREVALMRRLDRRQRITFINVVSSTNQECPVDRQELLSRFHASEEGQLLSGAAAFAAMWRAIPILRPLGLAARVPFVLMTLEWSYRLFLKIRPSLQRLAYLLGDDSKAV